MTVTVCIGNSCHLKGSRRVVEGLAYLISENGLKDKVDLGGKFCMDNCPNGVCVTVDEKEFSITPDTIEDFFKTEILGSIDN